MKALIACTLFASVLSAQAPTPAKASERFEVSLFLGQQSYESGFWAITNPVSWRMDYNIDKNTVYAARFSYLFADLDSVSFRVSGAYQPEISTSLDVTNTFGSSVSHIASKYNHGYTAVGAMMSFKAPASFGIGLDYRQESVSMDDANNGSAGIKGGSGNLGRPWLRANLMVTLGSGSVKPVLGLEWASALTSSPSMDASSKPDDIAKHLAPKTQIGLSAGLRF